MRFSKEYELDTKYVRFALQRETGLIHHLGHHKYIPLTVRYLIEDLKLNVTRKWLIEE